MKIVSSLLLASALALSAVSAAVPAFAQEESTVNDRNLYVFMNGKMHRMKVSDAHHAMIMQKFRQMPPGTMIYYSGGAFFMGEDSMMPNGKMMSSEIFGRDFGFAPQR